MLPDPNAHAVSPVAGAVTATGFSVMADIASKVDGSAQLVVATDEAMTQCAFVSPGTLPSVTASNAGGGVYRTVLITASGLAPDTKYFYRVDVDGALGAVQSLRTAPAAGQGEYTFVIGSCSAQHVYSDFEALYAAAALQPDYIHFLGDMVYTDIKTDDILLPRARNIRVWKNVPAVAHLIRNVPVFANPDNHDSAGFGWTDSYPGTTYQKVVQNGLQAFRETMPLPELAAVTAGHADLDRLGLAYSYAYGNTLNVVLDTVSFRAHKTVIGAEQLAWAIAEMERGSDAGFKRIHLLSGENFSDYVPQHSWLASGSPELAQLLNAARHLPAAVMMFDGDLHCCGFTENFAIAASPGLTIPRICSSGIACVAGSHPPLEALARTFSWTGKPAHHAGNRKAFVHLTVDASGEWTADCYGEPYRGSAGTLLSRRTSTEQNCALTFAAAAVSAARGAEISIAVSKSWFGPVGGCSAQWRSNDGQSGEVKFGPNNGLAHIQVRAPAFGSLTVSLDNPSNCLIGARSSTVLTAV